LLLAFSFVPATLAQQTIHVPADRPTIQAGINADTVLVSPGTYNENIDFLGNEGGLSGFDLNSSGVESLRLLAMVLRMTSTWV
jgi:hypothetical protein